MTSDFRPFSIEVFPWQAPDGVARFERVVAQMSALGPDFISVTYGAGGGSRNASLDAVSAIRTAGTFAVPHVSAMAASRGDIADLLAKFRADGIRHLVVLRGDNVSGLGGDGQFPFAADLVRFIRAEFGAWFRIDVAAYPECHPEARSCAADLEHFKAKVDAGADSAITQFFFNADAYEDFRDRCLARGIDIPIVPGIMPIGNFSRLVQFSEMRGIEVPRWIKRRIADFGDDRRSIGAFGTEIVVRLCARLLELQAPGLHFFSLNNADRVEAIWRQLRPAADTGKVGVHRRP
jgi:methylenetetrahydrofolate reductase (NADPH)